MASPYSGSVTCSQVGSYFVGQYYQVLQTMPDCAYRFYNEQIYTLLTSLNFTGIEIKTINSLESLNGGILVMVSGSLKTKDFVRRRKFVQSFFLAPQEKGYFVLNDIFQFLDEDTITQPQASIEPENIFESNVNSSRPVSAPEKPVFDYSLEEEARVYMNSVCIEDDTVDKYSLPDQQELQEPECETVVEEAPVEDSSLYTDQDAWPDVVEEPIGEPEKKTYASILRVSKGPSVSTASQPPFRTVPPPEPEWQYIAEPADQQPNSASYVSEAVGWSGEESLAQEEDEFNSVYVKSLPLSVTAQDIEEEFKNFGTIKPDGVFIRSRKDIGVCYAFVEFEDNHGVQNAIQASPIQLGGRQVYIEERRESSSASRGGRRGGRGRGSYNYSAEAPRGRYVPQGSIRGTNNSNNNNGEYHRARGNGFYQRSSRQAS